MPNRSNTHIHVGQNVPGYLPEGEPACFDDLDSAIEYLRHELKDQQDYYYEQCDGSGRCDGHESLDGAHMGESVHCDGSCNNQACECEWCDLAADVEAVLAAIADRDVYWQPDGPGYDGPGWIFRTPEGPDMCHWLKHIHADRAKCDLNEDGE